MQKAGEAIRKLSLASALWLAHRPDKLWALTALQRIVYGGNAIRVNSAAVRPPMEPPRRSTSPEGMREYGPVSMADHHSVGDRASPHSQ